MQVQDPITGNWFPISSVPVPGTMRLLVEIFPEGHNDGGTRRAELAQAVEVLWRVAAAMVSTQAVSGMVTDRNGLLAARWTYTPTATN